MKVKKIFVNLSAKSVYITKIVKNEVVALLLRFFIRKQFYYLND